MSSLHASSLIDKAIHYLHSKQSQDGGFCAYNMEFLEESNPHDTFFAVLALQTLDEVIPNRDRVIQYLQTALAKAQVFNYAFFPLWTLHNMGELTIDAPLRASLMELPILLPDRPNPEDAGENLRWLLRRVQAKTLVGTLPEREQIQNYFLKMQQGGSFGWYPNLVETYLSLRVLHLLGYDIQQLDATHQFLMDLQEKETGFTNTKNGLFTTLDVVYAGVFACQLLGVTIQYPESVVHFTELCQMGKGGFARMPTGLPDIEKTYRAVKILKALGQAG